MTPNARSERERLELNPVAERAAQKVDRIAIIAAAIAMCEEGGFDPNEIMSNDGPRWRYYVPGAEVSVRAYLSALPAQPDHFATAGNMVSVEEVAQMIMEKCGSLDALDEGDALSAAQAILSRIQGGKSAPAIPEGWALVPSEPTEEMLKLRIDQNGETWPSDPNPYSTEQDHIDYYRAMIAASPKPEGA